MKSGNKDSLKIQIKLRLFLKFVHGTIKWHMEE